MIARILIVLLLWTSAGPAPHGFVHAKKVETAKNNTGTVLEAAVDATVAAAEASPQNSTNAASASSSYAWFQFQFQFFDGTTPTTDQPTLAQVETLVCPTLHFLTQSSGRLATTSTSNINIDHLVNDTGHILAIWVWDPDLDWPFQLDVWIPLQSANSIDNYSDNKHTTAPSGTKNVDNTAATFSNNPLQLDVRDYLQHYLWSIPDAASGYQSTNSGSNYGANMTTSPELWSQVNDVLYKAVIVVEGCDMALQVSDNGAQQRIQIPVSSCYTSSNYVSGALDNDNTMNSNNDIQNWPPHVEYFQVQSADSDRNNAEQTASITSEEASGFHIPQFDANEFLPPFWKNQNQGDDDSQNVVEPTRTVLAVDVLLSDRGGLSGNISPAMVHSLVCPTNGFVAQQLQEWRRRRQSINNTNWTSNTADDDSLLESDVVDIDWNTVVNQDGTTSLFLTFAIQAETYGPLPTAQEYLSNDELLLTREGLQTYLQAYYHNTSVVHWLTTQQQTPHSATTTTDTNEEADGSSPSGHLSQLQCHNFATLDPSMNFEDSIFDMELDVTFDVANRGGVDDVQVVQHDQNLNDALNLYLTQVVANLSSNMGRDMYLHQTSIVQVTDTPCHKWSVRNLICHRVVGTYNVSANAWSVADLDGMIFALTNAADNGIEKGLLDDMLHSNYVDPNSVFTIGYDRQPSVDPDAFATDEVEQEAKSGLGISLPVLIVVLVIISLVGIALTHWCLVGVGPGQRIFQKPPTLAELFPEFFPPQEDSPSSTSSSPLVNFSASSMALSPPHESVEVVNTDDGMEGVSTAVNMEEGTTPILDFKENEEEKSSKA